ncbi:MAG: TonB-dependent receptor, partial [Calditrichaeota bacterium]|nr:TonB-dependent receptor [Calditrichota bacterium]
MRRWLWLLWAVLAIPALGLAQSSGKIVGFVHDASNDEPLPGVNISIDGTTMGSASDVDGYFVIINVPVGIYDLRADFVGYTAQVLSGIRITADKTTEANFGLKETVIEGETVVITAERPLVEKNITQSVSLMTSEELVNIPVRNFNELLATQNSVVFQDNNVYIRGGRTEEVGYFLDGASATDPLTNTQAVYIIRDAVEEIQVQAGGYTAEFGGANSGIVRTELKSGGPDYKASFDFQTDKFAGEGDKFLGTYSYRNHLGVASLSGPLFHKNLRFFLAGENNYEGDFQRRFSKGFTFDQLIDTNPNADPNNPDTVSLAYPDGFTPFNEQNRWAMNGTVSLDLSPLQFRVSGVWQSVTTDINRQPMLRILNNRNFADENSSLLLTGKITHVISPKSLYEVNLGYFNSSLERVDDYFGGDWTQWWDSLAVSNHTGGRVEYASRYSDPDDYSFNGFPFERDGAARRLYRVEKVNYWSGGLNYFGQIGHHHELKIGGEARLYQVRHFDIDPQVISLLETQNVANLSDLDPALVLSNGSVNAYGYDHLGNESDEEIDYGNGVISLAPKKPMDVSFYIQDKIEYRDLVINAGLRYDYLYTDDRELANPTNPVVDRETNYILASEWIEKDGFSQISPRLGVSFPVSEATVFYLQYGKFVQKPELDDLFWGNSRYREQIGVGGNFYTNPVGFGLDPVRTTSYEIGFRQQLSSVAALDIAGFYKNVIGQVQAKTITVAPDATISNYVTLDNGDFSTTQGLEFALTLRRVNRVQAQLNYTFTNSEGTASNEFANLGALNQNNPLPTTIQPLTFGQRHVGSVILDVRNGPENKGFFRKAGANMLFRFNSGHP